MDDDKRIDSFDDLFEPFDLDDAPEDDSAPPPPIASEPEQVAQVPCPSCGTANPEYNRHCEACGARLGSAPLPVAPPPMVRNTPGSRALGVLAALVLVVALGALFFNFFNGGDEEAAPQETTTTTTEAPQLVLTRLIPTSVEASSSLTGFEPEGLIDNDPTTIWNDASNRGNGATLTFRFQQPVQIVEMEIHNLTDEERFTRNYRVQGYTITLDDLATPVSSILEDTREVQTIEIPSVRTTELTFEVKSVHPASTWNGAIPYDELAVQEIRFYGYATNG
ncbi:MAG: hypothetical protein HKN07_10195 [Acidimicrobiia bacterium]|nr:hypothetical protein [Acidimicrobiia bacterium]